MHSTDQPPAQALPDPPVAMFSGPGHQDTLWSDVKGNVAHSKTIKWVGGVAATHAIVKVSGAAEVRTRLFELHFSWNSGVAEADAEAGKRVWAYKNRPRYGLILPPGTNVEFRIKEKSNYRFLTMELEPEYLLRVAELEHLSKVEFIETWEYDDHLTWHLAEAIFKECESGSRQGLLYSETAATLLALHVAPQSFEPRSPGKPGQARRAFAGDPASNLRIHGQPHGRRHIPLRNRECRRAVVRAFRVRIQAIDGNCTACVAAPPAGRHRKGAAPRPRARHVGDCRQRRLRQPKRVRCRVPERDRPDAHRVAPAALVVSSRIGGRSIRFDYIHRSCATGLPAAELRRRMSFRPKPRCSSSEQDKRAEADRRTLSRPSAPSHIHRGYHRAAENRSCSSSHAYSPTKAPFP